MLFNHWFLINKDFVEGIDVEELREAWEIFEEEGVDSITIGKGFTGMMRAVGRGAIEVVEQDEFEAKIEAGIIKRAK